MFWHGGCLAMQRWRLRTVSKVVEKIAEFDHVLVCTRTIAYFLSQLKYALQFTSSIRQHETHACSEVFESMRVILLKVSLASIPTLPWKTSHTYSQPLPFHALRNELEADHKHPHCMSYPPYATASDLINPLSVSPPTCLELSRCRYAVSGLGVQPQPRRCPVPCRVGRLIVPA